MTKFSASQQNQLAQIGAFLRDNREKQEKSLEDIAIRTYIRPQLLNGIETGNPDTLPEPIFVQGFIRRYGEALGLNGRDLAQQFTVSSIPSTPRPAPPAPLSDTPTTRLTRNALQPQNAQPEVAIPVAAPIPTMPNMQPVGASAEDLTLGRIDNDPVASVTVPPAQTEDLSNSDAFRQTVDDIASEQAPASQESFEAQLSEITQPEANLSEVSADIPIINAANNADIDDASGMDDEEDFSSMIAAFDKENMTQTDLDETTLGAPVLSESAQNLPSLGQPETGNVVVGESSLESSTIDNASFDDNLPAAFTTEATAPAEPAELSAPTTSLPTEVSNDFGYEENQTNLKPFVLGGILAAVALLGLLIASVIGGGNRQPSVAENPEVIEEVEGSELPPLPEGAEVEAEEPEVVDTPALSDAPIYVESTAIEEAWVSVEADGANIFEGILQPGDTQLWEAEESLSVYSANAGGVELAANGGEAEVMGPRGQLAERIFPEQ